MLFWFNRAEEHAEGAAEAPYTEEMTPVCLRVTLRGQAYETDEAGTRDAPARAVSTWETIPVEDLEIWDGEDWIVVEDYDSLDTSAAYTFEENPDDPDEPLEYFKTESPLQPTEP